MRILNFCVV